MKHVYFARITSLKRWCNDTFMDFFLEGIFLVQIKEIKYVVILGFEARL